VPCRAPAVSTICGGLTCEDSIRRQPCMSSCLTMPCRAKGWPGFTVEARSLLGITAGFQRTPMQRARCVSGFR
jgi:hypothetical protein